MEIGSLPFIILWLFSCLVSLRLEAAPRKWFLGVVSAGVYALVAPIAFTLAFVTSIFAYPFISSAAQNKGSTIYSKTKALAYYLSAILSISTLMSIRYILVDAGIIQLSGALTTGSELIGISYFVFCLISLVNDRSDIDQKVNFVDYQLYLFFFPKMLQGPIERYENFTAKSSKRISYYQISHGVSVFLNGALFKFVMADRLGSIYVDPQIASLKNVCLDAPSCVGAALSPFSYYVQLFFDFQGYTLMAIGVASTFGYTLSINFARPYLAMSITDFWRRWHMTLSEWLRDYFYYPFSYKLSRMNIAAWTTLPFTFIIIGLWHGFTINFLIFGIIHGALATLESTTSKRDSLKAHRWLYIVITQFLVGATFVFFRTSDLSQVGAILKSWLIMLTNLHYLISLPKFFLSPDVHEPIYLSTISFLILALGTSAVVFYGLLTENFKAGRLISSYLRPVFCSMYKLERGMIPIKVIALILLGWSGSSSFIYEGF